MSYYVARLKRPYDYHSLIEAYIYSQRKDFIHSDFPTYYASLLKTLEAQFGIQMSREGLTSPKNVFWSLFNSTVQSMLEITSPWAGYLEATLLHRKLDEIGDLGETVNRASSVIDDANKASKAAHREMLDALFHAIFGKCEMVVTSEALLTVGFDDAKEPDIVNYYDLM